MAKIKIDGKEYHTDKKYLLDALLELGFDVPHLCKHKDLLPTGTCRLCLVRVNGKVTTSCTVLVKDGLEVITNDEEIIKLRKMNLDLILSNHPLNCDTCFRNGNCELQKIAEKLNLSSTSFRRDKYYKPDDSSHAIVIDPNYCILCQRCIEVCAMQNMNILQLVNRGYETRVGLPLENKLSDTPCISCGQCVLHCPVNALHESYDIDDVMRLIYDKEYYVVAQVAPAIRVTIGEFFGMPGKNLKLKLPNLLKRLGFDAVVDTSFGADLTIMEEASELIKRLENNKNLPMFTSCCPAWVNYVEFFHHELLNHLSTARSPHIMLGYVIKRVFSEKLNIPMEKIKVVSIMPCTAKKVEARRTELRINNLLPVDYVLTTREIGKMISEAGIEISTVEDSHFDNLLEASSAGELFGSTGGVMEAALRTAYYFVNNKNIEKLEFEEIRGLKDIKISRVNLGKYKINVAVVHGIGKVEELLKIIDDYDIKFVEVMACPGGCIGGGGQPRPHTNELLKLRQQALYETDKNSRLRFSHENPTIKWLYDKYFYHPLSEESEKYLHTRYILRNPYMP